MFVAPENTVTGARSFDLKPDHDVEIAGPIAGPVAIPNRSVKTGPTPPVQANTQFLVYPDTIQLREDMTLSISGQSDQQVAGKRESGRWFQRYLPCHRRHPEVPPKSTDADQSYRPALFSHPWRFLPDVAFRRASLFSHFGIYDQVDSRNQFYNIDLVGSIPRLDILDAFLWEDHQSTLYIRSLKFKWGVFNDSEKLEKLLGETLPQRIKANQEAPALFGEFFFRWDAKEAPDPRTEYRHSRTSMYNSKACFRILNRGRLGCVMVWSDKRDDDLLSLSDLPEEVSLASAESSPAAARPAPGIQLPKNVIRVRITRNVRVTRLPNVESVRLALQQDQFTPAGKSRLTIQFDSDQSYSEAIVNLWRIRIYALPDDSGNPVRIYDVSDLLSTFIKIDRFKLSGCTFTATVEIDKSVAPYVTETKARQCATSVWFEDVVGHVSTPDWTAFDSPSAIS